MNEHASVRNAWLRAASWLAVVALTACSDPASPGELPELSCSIPSSLIVSGGPPKDGIPALTDPLLVRPGEEGTEYLRDDDRVVGLDLGGDPIAIPLNIFWWHEIVNLSVGDLDLAITHCPLTGSSLAFDRAAIGGGEFGVSGLLYMNNLLMYDRTTSESLWPQMLRGARCGPRDGTELRMVPVIGATWAGWRSLHPDTRVASSRTAFPRDYRLYPYGDYDEPSNPELLFPIPDLDRRRPPKERTLGIPDSGGGLAFPFGILDELGPRAAVNASLGGRDIAVFWERERGAAMAYDRVVDGRTLSFFVDASAGITDTETGTVWAVNGIGTEGELAGTRLEPVADAFVSFWFAWSAFHPDAELWSPS